MKKSLLFSAVLAGLMLGSCSSSDDLAGGNTSANQDGSGYISLSLNLPTRSGSMSRAQNDKFDDGLTNEYAVKDGTLLLFEGTDEASATFAGAYTLKNLSMNIVGTATDNITTTTKITQKINNGLKNGSNNFYAIVVLNKNNTLEVDNNNATLKVNGADFGSTKKISDLEGLELTKSVSDFNGNGFLMMNAPLSNVAGGTSEPTGATVSVASVIDKDHIYETEALAKANTSATIYVERALAKVDVTSTAATGNLTDASSVNYEIKGWVLDNTNKKTFYLRNTSNASEWLSLATKTEAGKTAPSKPYRFVGDDPMEGGASLYRTYWAKDPNYDAKPADLTADFSTIGNAVPTTLKNLGDYDYCLENTFTVGQQNQDVTTRVIVAAKIGSGSTFYVVNDNEKSLLGEDDMKKAVKGAFLTNTEVQTWIKNGLKTGETIGDDDLEVTVASTAGNHKPTVSIKTTSASKYTSGTAPVVDAKIQAIMDGIKVATYADGISYYPVRIKHFGDDLTPWKNTETPLPTVSDGAYPSTHQAENYLGRYGVLRNNWYNIDVQGIKKLGSPVVPEVTGDKDDELAAYISVKINVLSWAKRTQGAILGQ